MYTFLEAAFAALCGGDSLGSPKRERRLLFDIKRNETLVHNSAVAKLGLDALRASFVLFAVFALKNCKIWALKPGKK
jgi:hypothetical protein